MGQGRKEFQTWWGHHFAPKYGVVELLATRGSVTYEVGGEQRSHAILAPPVILTACTGSITYTAVDAASPVFGTSSLANIAEDSECFVLHENPDGHRANKRKTEFTARMLPRHGLFISFQCSCLTLHLIIEDQPPYLTIEGPGRWPGPGGQSLGAGVYGRARVYGSRAPSPQLFRKAPGPGPWAPSPGPRAPGPGPRAGRGMRREQRGRSSREKTGGGHPCCRTSVACAGDVQQNGGGSSSVASSKS